MYYCNRVVVEAPGKVNLSLDITGNTLDGYHLLETVMQSVSLCDVLVISKINGAETRITCTNPAIPENDKNTVFRAAREFFAAVGLEPQGLAIHIDKIIPMEAGLAGGSADAAAVLRGMDRLFETALSPEQLSEIGLRIGMDVPFCLDGGCALAQGRGEVLTKLKSLPHCIIAIAKPPEGMSTRYAFKLYDDLDGEPGRPDTQGMLEAIANGDLEGVGRNMHSVFGCIGLVDETEMISGIMLCAGALGSVVSGSGSSVVGLFDREREAKDCLRLLKEQVPEAWLTAPTDFGAKILYVG